jgi:hypothetical protein
MRDSETPARRIVAYVARATADQPMGWVMLDEVARHLQVDEATAETAMGRAAAWGWLKYKYTGSSRYRVGLTPVGRALPRPH